MSIFGNLMSKIEAIAAPSVSPVSTAAPGARAVVDVEAVLDGVAAKSTRKLNWRTSIVQKLYAVRDANGRFRTSRPTSVPTAPT
jgi:hypothetical protein